MRIRIRIRIRIRNHARRLDFFCVHILLYVFFVGRQRHTRTSCHGCEEPKSGQIFIYFHNRATNKVHLAGNCVVYAYPS
jgi:hypothetical protein